MLKPKMGVMSKIREAPKKQSPGVPNINWKQLIKFCRMKINSFEQFGKRFDTPNGPYFYRDNGSDILLIAHLDYYKGLGPIHTTTAHLADDTIFFCPTLDDRAGVYAILDYLPTVGLKYDILLTTGEEQLKSSALFFKPPKGKRYNWMASFDRRGTDLVLYDYRDPNLETNLKECGWNIGIGTYSDIADLEHLRCKGINFGVGYYNEHTTRCFLSRKDFIADMRKFLRFYKKNSGAPYPHTPPWNRYTKEDGFSFQFKPKSEPYQDMFTDEDIEILEMLEREGFEYGATITPRDMENVIQAYREKTGIAKALGQKNKQTELFDDPAKEAEELDIKVVPLQRGSEDNPEYGIKGKDQPRKAADLIADDDEVTTTVYHGGRKGKEDLHQIESQAHENGMETILIDKCTTCHKEYETTASDKTTQCPDCRGEVVDAVVVRDEDDFRLTAKMVIQRPKERDVRYEYKHYEGKGWAWVEQHQQERVPA